MFFGNSAKKYNFTLAFLVYISYAKDVNLCYCDNLNVIVWRTSYKEEGKT